MSIKETALLFECEGDELLGIVSEPGVADVDVGVLVVVGGPQYRVGSHRQFVLLARQLAEQGIPCMRFDYRGMGDAAGAQRSFEDVDEDIRAAIDVFVRHVPGVKRVVLWGLCDGASAACLYAPLDDRVVGSVLLNPWVKTAQGEARTYLRHYYLKRLFDPSFWKKLASGGVSLGRSVGGVLGAAKTATLANGDAGAVSLPERMGRALGVAAIPFCVILSSNDYVAKEFESIVPGSVWQQLLQKYPPLKLDAADHTFSSAVWRNTVAEMTISWVRAL